MIKTKNINPISIITDISIRFFGEIVTLYIILHIFIYSVYIVFDYGIEKASECSKRQKYRFNPNIQQGHEFQVF